MVYLRLDAVPFQGPGSGYPRSVSALFVLMEGLVDTRLRKKSFKPQQGRKRTLGLTSYLSLNVHSSFRAQNEASDEEEPTSLPSAQIGPAPAKAGFWCAPETVNGFSEDFTICFSHRSEAAAGCLQEAANAFLLTKTCRSLHIQFTVSGRTDGGARH